MALTLYVDSTRWRAHHKHVLEQFPGGVQDWGRGIGVKVLDLAEVATEQRVLDRPRIQEVVGQL